MSDDQLTLLARKAWEDNRFGDHDWDTDRDALIEACREAFELGRLSSPSGGEDT